MNTTQLVKSPKPVLSLAFCALFSVPVFSGELTYPDNSFVDGDTLSAAELNAKFNEIKSEVNDNVDSITANADAIAANGDGDITQVNAGYGLTGGGASGNVTLNLDTDTQPALGRVPVSFIATSTTSVSPEEFAQISVTIPAPGIIFLQVNGNVYMDVDAPGASSAIASGSLHLCTAPASNLDVDCEDDSNRIWFQDADSTQNTNTTEAYVLTKTFVAETAGTYTFYLNAQTHNAPSSFYIYFPDTTKATAMYFPQALTVTSP